MLVEVHGPLMSALNLDSLVMQRDQRLNPHSHGIIRNPEGILERRSRLLRLLNSVPLQVLHSLVHILLGRRFIVVIIRAMANGIAGFWLRGSVAEKLIGRQRRSRRWQRCWRSWNQGLVANGPPAACGFGVPFIIVEWILGGRLLVGVERILFSGSWWASKEAGPWPSGWNFCHFCTFLPSGNLSLEVSVCLINIAWTNLCRIHKFPAPWVWYTVVMHACFSILELL